MSTHSLGGQEFFAETSTRPFSYDAGERFPYAISWLGIPAGTAIMEVTNSAAVEGRPTLKLLTTARSNDFVSIFFPVNNRIESTIDTQWLLPLTSYTLRF